MIRYIMNGIGILLLLLLLWKIGGLIKWSAPEGRAAGIFNSVGGRWMDQMFKGCYPASLAGEGGAGQQPPWYLALLQGIYPGSRIKPEEEQKTADRTDPAYDLYLREQKICREYEYLFLYGGEDTGAGAEQGKENEPEQDKAAALVQQPGGQTAEMLGAVPGKVYLKEQLADYDYLMKHFYVVHSSTTASRTMMSADEFLKRDFTLETGPEKPQILIYHTHSQETFADFGPDNPDATVVGIGNYLTKLLEQKGYNVIHDTSVYDLKDGELDRNKAYTYALDGITGILQKYPSIEVVLDVHRDGVREGVHLVSEVNGKPTANIMFFNGLSQTPTGEIEYLQNPYREDNLAFSFQLQLKSEAYFPGYTRKIYLKGLRYNLHLRPRSALIEVGAQTNTYEEALNAMEPLSELLDMVLQGK